MGTAPVTRFSSPSMRPIMAPQHSLGNLDSAWATITFHASLSILIIGSYLLILFIPEGLAEVLGGSVAEEGHDHSFAAFLHQTAADFACGVNVGSRGHSYQQALVLSQPARHVIGVLGLNPEVVVGERRVVNAGDDGRRHVLQSFQAMESGGWLGGNAGDTRDIPL